MAVTFDAPKREAFLKLYESGQTIEEAAARAGTTAKTVHTWASTGKQEASGERRDFSDRFYAIKSGEGDKRLTKKDLILLLEKQARKGSVQAIKLLLERPWERKPDEKPEEPKPSIIDQLAAKRAAKTAGGVN